MTKTTKIRAGYYEYKGREIELKDEKAEVYPGDLDYGQWTVTENNERWLATFSTLKEAKQAIR